jgi:hypothetical protein
MFFGREPARFTFPAFRPKERLTLFWFWCTFSVSVLVYGRIVGPKAMKFGGWQRLIAEYAKQFGIETPD